MPRATSINGADRMEIFQYGKSRSIDVRTGAVALIALHWQQAMNREEALVGIQRTGHSPDDQAHN